MAAVVQSDHIPDAQIGGIADAVDGHAAKNFVAEHVDKAAVPCAGAQPLGGVGGVRVPLVMVGVLGPQLVHQICHICLARHQAVGQAAGVGIGGGADLFFGVVQTAQDHSGLSTGGAGAAVEVAVLVAGEQTLGIAVGHGHLIIGGNGTKILNEQLGEHQTGGVGGLPLLRGGQVVHHLGHVIAADLPIHAVCGPGAAGGILLAHGGAAEQAVGIGHIHIGTPPVGRSPLGFDLIGVKQIAHHGDELGVGQGLFRSVLIVSDAGDQAVGSGLLDVGVPPVGGGHIGKGRGGRGRDGHGAKAQGKGDGSPESSFHIDSPSRNL